MGREHTTYHTSLTPDMQKQLVSDAKSFFAKSRSEVPSDGQVDTVIMKYALQPERLSNLRKALKKKGYSVHRDVDQLLSTLEVFSSPHDVVDRSFDPNYRRAKLRVEELIHLRFVPSPLTFSSNEDVMDAVTRKDTSAGYDRYITGRKQKGEYSDIALRFREETLNHALKAGTFGRPIRCFERLRGIAKLLDDWSVESVDCKDRLVNCVSFAQVLGEATTANPFQRAIQTQDWYATGKRPNELRRIVREIQQFGGHWVSIDYSKYDQTLPGWLIRDAFGIIFRVLKGDRWSSKQRREWEILVRDFIEKDFIGPNGDLIHACDGVPSGSRWTNVIDSLCNMLMLYTYQEWCKSKQNGQLTEVKSCICGDDNLIGYKGILDLHQMSEYMAAVFGTRMKAEACKTGSRTEAPQFLSCEWRELGCWRDPRELYIRMVWPERFRDYRKNPDMTPEMIVEAYCQTYYLGMKELIDVEAFRRDQASKLSRTWAESVTEQLPGIMRFERLYSKEFRIA